MTKSNDISLNDKLSDSDQIFCEDDYEEGNVN